jgi:hypothetical protein
MICGICQELSERTRFVETLCISSFTVRDYPFIRHDVRGSKPTACKDRQGRQHFTLHQRESAQPTNPTQL